MHDPFHLSFTDANYVANILFGTDPRRGRVGKAVCRNSPHVAEVVSSSPKTYCPKLASIRFLSVADHRLPSNQHFAFHLFFTDAKYVANILPSPNGRPRTIV